MNLQKTANTTLIVFAVVFVLIQAQSIIVPIVLATFLWFLVKEIREFINKITWIKNHIPRWVKTLFASSLLLVVVILTTNLLINNVQKLSESIYTYEDNLKQISKTIEGVIGVNLEATIQDYSGSVGLKSLLGNVLKSLTAALSSSFMILLYLIFILLEESSFTHKMKAIYTNKSQFDDINDILIKVDKSIGSYISIKTVVSILTATLSYVAMLIIGIDSALFFGFLIFILNFIPSVGSLIATLFPALMALLQYGNETYTPLILVIIFVGLIQVIVGNFLEPKLMGNSLNISSLVVIISLTVWGAIWGITGMVLSVPITVIMIIVFSHFPKTKNIAILLSEKGKINE